MADVRVRQAMNYAVNCEEIADGAARRHGEVLHRPRQLAVQQSRPEALSPIDPAKAKQLLDEAGWIPGADGVRVKNGVRLSLNFDTTNGSYLMDKEIAQVMADSWKAGRHRDQGPAGHQHRSQLADACQAGCRLPRPDEQLVGTRLHLPGRSAAGAEGFGFEPNELGRRQVRGHVQGLQPGVRPVEVAGHVQRGRRPTLPSRRR